MADEIRGRFSSGPDLAVEAPTGTGKSLAELAAGIDWLAADPEHRVVIATHTKHLQAQLASDVEELSAAAPDLLSQTSLVKGAANCLSMRGARERVLRHHRDDSCQEGGLVSDEVFAELVVYLVCRLVSSPTSLLAAHEARSVDTADVPAFFAEYSRGRWSSYLGVLSQAVAGDYSSTTGLGAHTQSVSEHLDAHRLVIANHALLFAHLDDLKRHGDKTLLIVDEAHAAEASATEAFSSNFVYQQVERAAVLLSTWAKRPDATEALRGRARNLEEVLGTERPVRMAMRAVDRLSGVQASEHGRARTGRFSFLGGHGVRLDEAVPRRDGKDRKNPERGAESTPGLAPRELSRPHAARARPLR